MTVLSVEMLLIAGRAVFLLFSFTLATVAFIRWRRATQAQTEVVLANHGIVLQRLADLEARVDATQVAISRLAARPERPQQLASPTAAPASAPGYQIAIRLAKGGASREELISGCGLSSHEAELVQRLHAPQSKPSARKPLPRTQSAA
jgi:alkylation response protein AidB-like acyl-CoA dehydrogenase